LIRWIIVAATVGSATSLATGTTWALLSSNAAGGPEQLISAALSSTPTALATTNNGCSGSNQETNVGVSWSDAQAATSDATGGSLVTGYSVTRAPTSGGTYSTAGSVSGSPSPTTFSDAPAVANTPVGLVINTAKQAVPLAEGTLSVRSAVTIGTASNEANAVQISPDGLTALVAEFTTGQAEVLTWSGSAWTVAKTLTVAKPTAVAIDPVPNASGFYVAYVVSDPGTTTNGSVYPIVLDGASSSLGAAIAVQHQANPTAIAITPNGAKIYVSNYNSSTVSAITVATAAVATITLPGTTPHPVALAITFDSSHVYVADRANNYVDDITVATNVVGSHISLAAGALNDTAVTTSGNPNLLALLPNGMSLYVAEYGAAGVQVINTALAPTPDTVAATISTGSGSTPIDLAATPNGCLIYGADSHSQKIFSITVSTNVEASLFAPACKTQDPQAMQVTPDNQYLVIVENSSCGEVQLLNTATNAVTSLTGVGTVPTMIAFPPVPIWYKAAATHSSWNSIASVAGVFSTGWNPGGWQ
jgi:YVTN family beta-propeller protein